MGGGGGGGGGGAGGRWRVEEEKFKNGARNITIQKQVFKN